MNIKGLLLGSAAALVAVSGARAADAIVIAEPEPMEYVRVCDTYGVGFYYIPGTETCLKVSGYMRYDIGIGRNGLENVLDRNSFEPGQRRWFGTTPPTGKEDDTYFKRARFALRVDSRAETELGTLRTYAQVNFNYDSGVTENSATWGPWWDRDRFTTTWDETSTSDYIGIEHAYIELGGFRVGKTDSMFSTFTGYSSGVANDGLVPYGPFGTHQIAYTFNGGNGFTAAVALEGGSGDYSIDSYVPHVVGGVGYASGWGGLSGVVGYDSVWEEWAVKGRLDVNAMEGLSLFLMAGWKSNGDEVYANNYYAQWGGDWAMWVGGAWQFNEKTTLNVEVGYDDESNFSTVVGLDYELVNNFIIKPEVIYAKNLDNSNFFNGEPIDAEWGGFLRFQANFGG